MSTFMPSDVIPFALEPSTPAIMLTISLQTFSLTLAGHLPQTTDGISYRLPRLLCLPLLTARVFERCACLFVVSAPAFDCRMSAQILVQTTHLPACFQHSLQSQTTSL